MASILSTIGKASSLVTSLKGLVVANKQTVISNLAIDCIHSETIEYTNAITDHPISTKSSISDHIYNEPITLTIDGTITDSSMRIYGIIETPLRKNSLDNMVKNARSLLPFGNAEKPSQAAFNILEKICKNKELVTVVCKRRVFKNMAIEKLSTKEDKSTANALNFSCTLKQVNIVSVKQTAYKMQSIKKAISSKVVNSTQKPPEANLSSSENKGLVPAVKIESKSKIADGLDSAWDWLTNKKSSPSDKEANIKALEQSADVLNGF